MKRIETNKRGDVKILNDTNTQKFSETIKKKKKREKTLAIFLYGLVLCIQRERDIKVRGGEKLQSTNFVFMFFSVLLLFVGFP